MFYGGLRTKIEILDTDISFVQNLWLCVVKLQLHAPIFFTYDAMML